ncbi:succinyl-CoA synthetase-like protein [Xylariaceae sp. FL1019]|nr:succinyl-CoA synthetase-like protein [Xylariaceae sp. FL1019]
MRRGNTYPALAGKLPRRYASRTTNRRCFGSTTSRLSYDLTLKNLKIGSHTRVIFQGFTGKQATANAQESIKWGTNIVGGVTPGRTGEHLGLPVLPSVRKAMEVLKPDATGIYVAAHQATAAIKEAIEAEVPLIVAVAEHIPLHDFITIHSMLKTQSVSRLVGANSPGIISAVGKCRIGFQPLPCFKPGRIGIVARSGTLSYETAASTLRSELGQSLCIGVGGDILPGTTLKDGLQILAEDKDTEAIALVGEIGGDAEMEAAAWIKEYNMRETQPKPIAAIIGGRNTVPGRIFGHAGAFALPGEPSAQDKVEALQLAGATIVNHPSRFGPTLKIMLTGSTPSGRGIGAPRSSPSSQRRGIHTAVSRPTTTSCTNIQMVQKRSIYLTQSTAFDLLAHRSIPIAEETSASRKKHLLAITVNRSTNTPCVVVSPTVEGEPNQIRKFDYPYNTGAADLDMNAIASYIGLEANNGEIISSLRIILNELVILFAENEAFLLETHLIAPGEDSPIAVAAARFGFDDAAHRSGKRQADIQALRDTSAEDAAEVGVEKYGIVYIKLPDGEGEKKVANIGTLVNGAGLAMNTIDALADAGGRAANFLDTGGKATSDTVKKSFEVILKDPRVKCIFVNIFGGLTLGDMIARGVVLAFSELHMSVPVVVRIRGTNEKEGQRIIEDSGLPLFAFDDFDEAAAKAIELANQE